MEVKIEDPELASYIKETSDLRGYELFRYKESCAKWKSVDSQDVNE